MPERLTYDDWLLGDALAVGRALLAPLAPDEQVARAVEVLDLCRSKWRPVREVERVSQIGHVRHRWSEGYDAFDAVRSLTLRERRRRTSDVYGCLLLVAEIAAKIIYNASGRPAPFDANSPVRLASNARDFVKALGEPGFDLRVWNALSGVSRAS